MLAKAASSRRLAIGVKLCRYAARLRVFDGVFARPASLVAGIFESAAVGLMRPEDVEHMVSNTYESRPDFYNPNRYNICYEQRIIPKMKRHGFGRKLLNGFCGQGREAKLFAEAGYDVTAIDRLGWMIDSANRYAAEERFEAKFEVADFYDYVTEERFDLVYTSCWMYSTIQGAAGRRRFLDKLATLVKPEGTAVISYVSARCERKFAAGLRLGISRVVGRLTNGNSAVEHGERIYTGLFWHHLSQDVVCSEVKNAGWEIIESVTGEQLEPTFVFIRRQKREDASPAGGTTA
ncbi:MAG: class I SAM-dependent methyltransferase [Planctomycetota bacterium]